MKNCNLCILAAFASLFLIRPALAQQPPVCATVTADQTGANGLNTAAIQAKLDGCAGNSKQVSVELSAAKGAAFSSGALYVPSNVVLWLDAGVTLNASTNPADFQRSSSVPTAACDSSGAASACGTLDANNTGCQALINSCKSNNAGVGGTGTIEGHGWSALTGGPNTGTTWWALAGQAKAGNYVQSLNAPKMINFQQSTSITLSGFTIHNAPLVHILLGRANVASITQVTIVTPTPDHTISAFPYNSDGMDLSGSSNVQVDRVDFTDGDDNIAMEAGGGGAVKNISVTNSTFRAGHGLSIGSETNSGATNVSANNIRFIGTDNGLRIKSDPSKGGLVDSINYSDICMTSVGNPIVIDPNYSTATGNLLPLYKNVEVDNMWADSGSLTLKALAGQPPLSLTLNNVRIDNLGPVGAANANITEISDPNFNFPIAIPKTSGVSVTQSQAPAAAPADIRSYCRAALGLGTGGAAGPTLIDDTFANGNSQLQDLPNNSMWLFNGRANNTRTDGVGSVTFDLTPAGTSSDAFWAFFTNSGSPVVLGVGDTLAVAVTFSLTGFANNGQDVRWGVLNSLGTRNTANLTGGMNNATFANNPGYALDYFASGTGNPFVIARRTTLSSTNVFNTFADFTPIPGSGASARQALVDNTKYTLNYTIQRVDATNTRISTSVTGGNLSNYSYTSTENSPTPNTAFDYFAFRTGGTNFTNKITFTELRVQYTPAPPVIVSQPQPTSLTLQVGGQALLAVGASGNQVTYQWQLNGQAITNNPTALTPVLKLSNVQHSDAGSYTVVIANAGGSVTSSAVTLQVSDTPVPPPPVILIQPVDRTVTVGRPTSLDVTTLGDNFVYQWFKNGVLIPGSNGSLLSFHSAQATDAGVYSVVVSSSSGSVTSTSARLTVVSTMSAVGFRPYNTQAGICTDTPLYVAFDQPPTAGTSGRVTVYNSKGTVVDTLDMSSSPQTKVIGGAPFVYYPVIVTGNIAAFYLHQQLPANDTYSVTMDPGVLTDAAGVPFAGFTGLNFWKFGTVPAIRTVATGATSFTVAFDGGDYCTVQGAVDAVPAANTQAVTITVKPGTFTEIVYVPSNKPFITVQGADRIASVVQYPNNNNLNPAGVSARASFGVDAPDFTLQNITLWNTTPHGGSQAEAFRGNNQRILLNRVTLKSFQDTLMLQGAGMVTDSYIEGDVDFMWGSGAVYLQNTELKALTANGYYTQIRNGQTGNGNVYVNCTLDAASGVTGSYLGRIDPTVYPYSQVIYINSAMGPQIIPVGWLLNNATTAPNVQFWEYKSTDLTGAALDVSQRATFSRQLTATEAAKWSDPSNVLGGWVPYTVNATTSAVAVGAAITTDWSATPNHSAKDWIGLYAAGDASANYLSKQYISNATTGHLTVTAPLKPGTYELRLYQNDGFTLAATGNTFIVQ
jgi:pectin methylesterase-like acyl-CoA thioesterase